MVSVLRSTAGMNAFQIGVKEAHSMTTRILSAVALLLIVSTEAFPAVCVNKFVKRSETTRQFVTLLTGNLTFQEAQTIAQKPGSIGWVDEKGKVIATAIGARAVRPMPVGCDGKTSGTVLTVEFLSARPPSKKMQIRFAAGEAVDFDEQ
jgi:hypothetical protein